jgi:hypothetical protein
LLTLGWKDRVASQFSTGALRAYLIQLIRSCDHPQAVVVWHGSCLLRKRKAIEIRSSDLKIQPLTEDVMSVQKKSLISQRSAVKSAILATPETSTLTPAARPAVKPAKKPSLRQAKKTARRSS